MTLILEFPLKLIYIEIVLVNDAIGVSCKFFKFVNNFIVLINGHNNDTVEAIDVIIPNMVY